MKCLTLIQPWASLIVDLRKPYETRSWETSHRGALGVHAGKTVDVDACQQFGYDHETIPTGAILGIAFLAACVKLPSRFIKPDPYGDYSPGRFAWVLHNTKPLDKPLPMKGAQRLWNCEALDKTKQARLFDLF